MDHFEKAIELLQISESEDNEDAQVLILEGIAYALLALIRELRHESLEVWVRDD